MYNLLCSLQCCGFLKSRLVFRLLETRHIHVVLDIARHYGSEDFNLELRNLVETLLKLRNGYTKREGDKHIRIMQVMGFPSIEEANILGKYENILTKDPWLHLRYLLLQKREVSWRELEACILTSKSNTWYTHEAALEYLLHVRKRQWPEYETSLVTSNRVYDAYRLARAFITRFEIRSQILEAGFCHKDKWWNTYLRQLNLPGTPQEKGEERRAARRLRNELLAIVEIK